MQEILILLIFSLLRACPRCAHAPGEERPPQYNKTIIVPTPGLSDSGEKARLAMASLVIRIPKRDDARAILTPALILVLFGLVGIGGCALLFLVPLYADPALSALPADFDPLPTECVTYLRDDRHGLDNCTWGASCREGCTGDVCRCIWLHVRYKRDDWVQAVLYVNITGCGYPPAVNCDNFTASYGYKGARYPCYWSRTDPRVVVPQWSREEQLTTVACMLALTLCVSVCAAIGLCALYCDCSLRCRRRPSRLPAPAAARDLA